MKKIESTGVKRKRGERGKQKKPSAISCVTELKPLILDVLKRALKSRDRWERLKAAKIVAPYVFQEMPKPLEHSGETTVNLHVTYEDKKPSED